jgi:hypothetical protein
MALLELETDNPLAECQTDYDGNLTYECPYCHTELAVEIQVISVKETVY